MTTLRARLGRHSDIAMVLAVLGVLTVLFVPMMPPMAVSLPLKILMFILVDGWTLILKALVGSFR